MRGFRIGSMLLPAGVLLAGGLLWAAPGLAEDPPELLERSIEHELSTIGSRVTAPSGSAVELFQTGRQLQITRQRLDSLQTWTPQNEAIPLLERRLDRLERPIGVGRPPIGARDPLPPRSRARRLGGF